MDNVENFLRLKSIVKNNKEIFSVKSSSLVKRYLKKMTKDLFNFLTKGKDTIYFIIIFLFANYFA